MAEVEKPKRVQLSRKRGWRMPPNTVKVDRASRFGNPYRVGSTMYLPGEGRILIRDNAHAVACFRTNVCDLIAGALYRQTVKSCLRGKNLACWCKPGEPCHADVLLDLANG